MASAAAMTQAQQAYLAYYGRPADPLGQTYWAGQIDAHGLSSIINAFGTSAEATSLYGSLDTVHAINAIYNQQFGHDADPAGLNFYFQGVSNGTFTLASLALNVYNGATGTDATVVANRIAVATTFTAHLDTTTEILSYSGTAAANAARSFLATVTSDPATVTSATANVDTTILNLPSSPGTTFTLTTGADTPTANLFNAVLTTTATSPATQTLQGFDSLTGTTGSTSNTLAIIDGTAGSATTGDALPAGLTLSNIQNITLTTSNNAGVANTADAAVVFTTPTGVTKLTVTSNGANGDNIRAAAATDVTETYNGTGGTNNDFIAIRGGNNVTVTDNGSSAGVLVGAGQSAVNATIATSDAAATAATAAAGAVVVNENGAGAVYVEGGTTVNVNSTVASGSAGLTSIGAVVAPTGAVTVTQTVSKGTAGLITVAGGASDTITSNVAGAAASVAVTSGVTGTSTITANGVGVTANGISVAGGTGVTINTTGVGATGNTNGLALGAAIGAATTVTTAIGGNATVTDTFSGPASYNELFNITAVTGAVSLTTTATNGAIVVGLASPTNDPTGNVTIVDQTVAGSSTYYGQGAVNVFTNGGSTVSVTGGKAGGSTIIDEGAVTKALTTVNLTGFQGAITATSSKLTNLSIANSVKTDPLNNAFTATAVTVTNSTADHTLAVALSGDTNTSTALVDNTAKVINVTASGTTANVIAITDTDTPASGGKTLSFTNNGTGTLTVTAGLTNTNSTTAVTVAGTGAVNLGDTTGWGVKPTSITGSGSGAMTATVDGQNTAFTGGSGANTVTLTSTGTLTQAINGGSGTNNTLIATSDVLHYSSSFGGSLSGFQNLELKGGAITSSAFNATGYTSLLASGLTATAVTAATVGNDAIFSSAAGGTALTVLDQAANSSAQFGGTLAIGDQIVINGVTYTLGSTTGTTEATAINALNIPGVSASGSGAGGTGLITITGAATATLGTTHVTTTITNFISGVVTETLAATPAAATGNTLPLTLNSATGAAALTTVIQEANNQTITINSVKDLGNDLNTVTIGDGTLTAAANQATKITITGAGKTTVTYSMDGLATPATNAMATIDASGTTGTSSTTVNVTGVVGRTAGMTITGGASKLQAFGSGLATGETAASYYAATDTITTGSGGSAITLGYAGYGVISGSGTQTVNLSASAAAVDTITIGGTADLGGFHATVNGFGVLASSKADVIGLNDGTSAILLNNVTVGTAVPAGTGVGSDTYTVSNGIITFTGADVGNTLISDAEAIVNTAGAHHVGAFTAGGVTYVVHAGSAATVGTDNVIALNGVSGVLGFGTTASSSTITLSAALAGTPGTTTAAQGFAAKDTTTTALTQDDTGYFEQYYSGVTTGAKVFNNLGPSAIIDSASTGSAAGYTLTTTQLGTAGSDSLTLNLSGAQTIAQASFTGDNALTINTTANSTITSLIDPGNTLAGITLLGANTLNIGAITDTALTSITVNATTGAVTLGGSATPLSQAGLTVTLKTVADPGNVVYLSGAGDTIDASAVTTGSASAIFSATGANSTIKAGFGANGETIIAGNNATVTMLQGAAASGSIGAVTGDNSHTNQITVGTNSTVNLGTTSAGVASDGGSTVFVNGDVTGALSSGAYTFVTINNVVDNATKIGFYAASTTERLGGDSHGFVNVASATSLANALDIAARNESAASVAGNHSYDWFQYGGSDYVVAHTGVAGTALSATDIVVKITGLIDLSGHFATSATGTGVGVIV